MAVSAVPKNFRDGTLSMEDGTGTPLTITIAYEPGDFSLGDLVQGQKDVAIYLDRGAFLGARHTNFKPATWSFSVLMTDVSDATDVNVADFLLKYNQASSNVSTLGASAEVYAVKITLTIEGTDHGDSADHTIVLDDCIIDALSLSEGDPNTMSASGRCLGTITMT